MKYEINTQQNRKKSRPKLIVINGCPGVGKSTLSQKYVDNHPMALNLDIDQIWCMIGQWQQTRPESFEQKMLLSYAMAEAHLQAGYDVIVAQHLNEGRFYEQFEKIASATGTGLIEIALRNDLEKAIERFIDRGKKSGHPDGFRPGGIMDTEGRIAKIKKMHEEVEIQIRKRPHMKVVEVKEGAIEHTYHRILDIVQNNTL